MREFVLKVPRNDQELIKSAKTAMDSQKKAKNPNMVITEFVQILCPPADHEYERMNKSKIFCTKCGDISG